jgi:predicted lysophospholipase L1 biosynthesis ABC-type transport system permease subunit
VSPASAVAVARSSVRAPDPWAIDAFPSGETESALDVAPDAYLVTQRYKEIGIRIALGVTRANILQLILARTFKLTALGILAGLIAAFFLSRFLSSILFGITAHDALTFVGIPVCLIVIAFLAGYLPARRATRVDPVTSLRYESRFLATRLRVQMKFNQACVSFNNGEHPGLAADGKLVDDCRGGHSVN